MSIANICSKLKKKKWSVYIAKIIGRREKSREMCATSAAKRVCICRQKVKRSPSVATETRNLFRSSRSAAMKYRRSDGSLANSIRTGTGTLGWNTRIQNILPSAPPGLVNTGKLKNLHNSSTPYPRRPP